MKSSYNNWRKRLGLVSAGIKPKDWPVEQIATTDAATADDCGFYRLPIRQRVPLKNGQGTKWKVVGFEPVALMVHEEALVAVISNKIASDAELNEKFLWFVSNPIPDDWYRAVAERGEPWPDSHETVTALPVANSSMLFPVPEGAKVTSPHNVISEQIDECAHQIIKYAKIESDEQSAKARSLQSRFLDLRGDVKREYEKLNDPLLAEQKRIREIWFPLRDLADAGSVALKTAMGRWEDEKRAATRLAAEAAEKAAREHAEQVAAAEKANQPVPPPPEPAKSNVPTPSAQIRGGAGRAAAVTVALFVTAIDEDAVLKQFKGNPAITELLISLAQKAIRAGIQVPGATTEERSIVR